MHEQSLLEVVSGRQRSCLSSLISFILRYLLSFLKKYFNYHIPFIVNNSKSHSLDGKAKENEETVGGWKKMGSMAVGE